MIVIFYHQTLATKNPLASQNSLHQLVYSMQLVCHKYVNVSRTLLYLPGLIAHHITLVKNHTGNLRLITGLRSSPYSFPSFFRKFGQPNQLPALKSFSITCTISSHALILSAHTPLQLKWHRYSMIIISDTESHHIDCFPTSPRVLTIILLCIFLTCFVSGGHSSS